MRIDYKKLDTHSYSKIQIREKANKLRELGKRAGIPIDVDLIAEKDLGLILTPIPSLQMNTGCEGFLKYEPLPEDINEYIAPALAKKFDVSQEAMKYFLNSNSINPYSLLK